MLDYEISGYEVYFRKNYYGRVVHRRRHFDTEDDAVNFIIDQRSNWVDFTLTQIRTAIL